MSDAHPITSFQKLCARKKKDLLILIEKAPNGVVGEGLAFTCGQVNKFHLTFYCNDFYSGSDKTESPFERLENDGFLIDLTEMPYEECAKGIISGPMVDLTLPTGKVKRFGSEERNAAAFMLPALGGAFQSLALRELVRPNSGGFPQGVYGGLDRIALPAYLEFWYRKGAKVGQKLNGKAIWLPIYGEQQELFKEEK